MTISVVVPAYNEEKLLASTLASIRAAAQSFDALGWTVELIVCDNNSTDATAETARQHGARVVLEPVNQIARARNTGAAAATGDWLIFVDADSRPSAGLFADVAAQIQSGRCLAGGSIVRLDEHNWLADGMTFVWAMVSRFCQWCAGSFIFCETRAFRQIGGFSLDLYVAEEIDLSRRLKKLARAEGKRLVILRKHPMETSARKLKLYSRKEYLGFFWKAILHHRRTVTNRDACGVWYDGRR